MHSRFRSSRHGAVRPGKNAPPTKLIYGIFVGMGVAAGVDAVFLAKTDDDDKGDQRRALVQVGSLHVDPFVGWHPDGISVLGLSGSF